MRHQGLPQGTSLTPVKIYPGRKELNEAYASIIEGEAIFGGYIIDVQDIQGEKYASLRVVPDYVAELGTRHVTTTLSLKLFGETESVMCHSYE